MSKILALTMGDRYGIGPELVARILADWQADDAVRPVLIGDRAVWTQACQVAA